MLWVVIEGPDGVGKTTLIEKLAKKLRQRGLKVHVTAEPSSSKIGELIRQWLLRERVQPPHVYALLFTADRYYHVHVEVLPRLHEGYVILQERYIESTIVYQSLLGLDEKWLEELNKYLPRPDLTVVLDLPIEEIVHRLKARRKEVEIFEQDLAFLEKVRSKYLEIARRRGHLVVFAHDLEHAADYVYGKICALIESRH